MKLVIRKRAFNALFSVAYWVEGQNTEGSGHRWLEKTQNVLHRRARSATKHALCRYESLARYNYRCFSYNKDWVVAYKIKGDKFIVSRFLWAKNLK